MPQHVLAELLSLAYETHQDRAFRCTVDDMNRKLASVSEAVHADVLHSPDSIASIFGFLSPTDVAAAAVCGFWAAQWQVLLARWKMLRVTAVLSPVPGVQECEFVGCLRTGQFVVRSSRSPGFDGSSSRICTLARGAQCFLPIRSLLPQDSTWVRAVHLSADGATLFVSVRRNLNIQDGTWPTLTMFRIDLASRTLLASNEYTNYTRGVHITSSDGALYLCDGKSVATLDPVTLEQRRRIDMSLVFEGYEHPEGMDGTQIRQICLHNGLLYMSDMGEDEGDDTGAILAVDPTSGALVRCIKPSGDLRKWRNPYGLAVTDDAIYVTDGGEIGEVGEGEDDDGVDDDEVLRRDREHAHMRRRHLYVLSHAGELRDMISTRPTGLNDATRGGGLGEGPWLVAQSGTVTMVYDNGCCITLSR